MTIEVKKTSEIKLGETYQAKVMAYGTTGTWKTGAGRTFPKPIFVIDTDQGELTNRGIEGIEYVEIAPDQLVAGTIPQAWNKVQEAKKYFLEHRVEYRTIMIDSLTTIADAALAHLMFINRHQITGRKDDQGASLPDLNMEKQLVINFLMELLGTGKHLYCICHEEITKNEFTGIVMRMPAARGQLQGKISIWFDEVVNSRMHTEKDGKVKPYWLVRGDSVYVAKTRLGNRDDIEAEQPANFIEYAKKCGVAL